jgi:hypothetical protein
MEKKGLLKVIAHFPTQIRYNTGAFSPHQLPRLMVVGNSKNDLNGRKTFKLFGFFQKIGLKK